MPFCRERLSAKRFIAGVGGNAPWPLPTVAPIGDAAYCVNRTDYFLLADNDIVEQAFKLRRQPRINQSRVGLFENAEQRQAGLGRHNILSLGY